MKEIDSAADRAWVAQALELLDAEASTVEPTPLVVLGEHIALPDGISVVLKDERQLPTGSLKFRLAYALFVHGLCSGAIHEDTVVVEASSGSTAVSEAYLAKLLGLRFVAVVPQGTSARKVELIEHHGGTCVFVDDPTALSEQAARIAADEGGHFMDQFANGERATDWHGGANLAVELLGQLEQSPRWFVCGAGTGTTATTFGRVARARRLATEVCVVDPVGSALLGAWKRRDRSAIGRPSRIEGIGRPNVPGSFAFETVDRMVAVADDASVAAAQFLERRTGIRAGGSTGTALWGALQLAAEMAERGERGTIAMLIADSGNRYADTVYDHGWAAREGLAVGPCAATLAAFEVTGRWRYPV